MAVPPILTARRTVYAVLIGATTFLLCGAALGFASAGGSGSEPSSTVLIPAPRDGDRWGYDATLSGDWELGPGDKMQVGKPFPYSEQRWSSTTMRGADGELHVVNQMRDRSLVYLDFGLKYSDHAFYLMDLLRSFDPVTAAPVAWEHAYYGAGSAGSTPPVDPCPTPILPCTQTGSDAFANATFTDFLDADESEACAPGTAFRDVEVPAQGEVQLFLRCGQGIGWASDFRDDTYQSMGVETIAGRSAVRYDSLNRSGVSVWLAPGISYPIRMEWPNTDEVGALRLDLAVYEPGAKPLVTEDILADRDPAPALQFAPRKPWGPDDTGVPDVFPASMAYKAAQASTSWPDLKEFLAAHPDAYAVFAQPTFIQDGDATEHSWAFVLADGADAFGFEVTRRYDPLVLPTGQTVPRAPEDSFGDYEPWFFDDALPAKDAVPDQLATVLSQRARWEAYVPASDLADGARGWTFQIECAGGACEEATVSYGAGQPEYRGVRDTSRLTPYGPNTGSMSQSMTNDGHAIFMRADGTVTDIMDAEATFTTSGNFGRTSGGAPSLPPPRDIDTKGNITSVAGVLGSPQATTGAGLIALLASGFYYLWPALKSGGVMGLFSRLRGDRLLEHPARSRLVDIVEAHPGIHFQELVRQADKGRGATAHHLGALVDKGLLLRRDVGGYACYFPPTTTRTQLAAAGAVKADGARRILAAVAAQPGQPAGEVARHAGVDASTVTHHVRRLEAAGLVSSRKEGRTVLLEPTAAAAAALAAAS